MQNLSLSASNLPQFIHNYLPTHLSNYTNPNFAIFSSLTETKSYVPISACVLEHILTTNNLTNHEKLYYLLADALALISKNKGGARSASLPSEEWAARLFCSRPLVFTMQKSLEQKGYFAVNKDFDKIGRNKRNLIIPTLPVSVFNSLNVKPQGRMREDQKSYILSTECKRSHLDKTQLFIKLNYNLLKTITSNKQLNSQQKIMWLWFYIRCYKNYMSPELKNSNASKYNSTGDNSFSFVTSYREITSGYSYNVKYISKSIKALEEANFIKAQRFYVREKLSGNNTDEGYSNNQGGGDGCYYMQERQDKSLWKITLKLPEIYTCELGELKDRANLDLSYSNAKVISVSDSVNSRVGQDDLSQESNPPNDTYVDSVIEELELDINLDIEDNVEEQGSLEEHEPLEEVISSTDGIKSDPPFADSLLLLNKNLKQITKSNLGDKPKVFFNKFLNKEEKPFNICSELIRKKLKELPKEKAEKARKYAYCLTSKKLAKGCAKGLNKHELAKQLIFHAATWKPTKLGSISREKQIDTALSVAWKKVENGTWQMPLEWSKAQILQAEFNCYAQKYKESGIFSNELGSLESATNKLLKTSFTDLKNKIIERVGVFESGFEAASDQVLAAEVITGAINDKSTGIELKKEVELPPFPEEQEFYLSYKNSQSMQLTDNAGINDHHNDLGSEDERNNSNQIIELPFVEENQKYLKLSCLEKQGKMVIKTINDKEYLVKFKAIESNEDGDMTITFENVKMESFIKELNTQIMIQTDNNDNKTNNIIVTNSLSNNSDYLTTDKIANDTICKAIVEKTLQQHFLNTKSIGQKPLESGIDTVLSCIAKQL